MESKMPATTPKVVNDPEWISLRQAHILMGCTAHRVLKLVALGQIRNQALPGQSMRYSRVDVVRIANERNRDGAELTTPPVDAPEEP
jgi:hypothetical protein